MIAHHLFCIDLLWCLPEDMFNITVDHNINDALNIWSRLHYRAETSAYLSRT